MKILKVCSICRNEFYEEENNNDEEPLCDECILEEFRRKRNEQFWS